MKLFWFLLMIFYVFIDRKHLAISATSTFSLTDYQEELVNELGLQISNALKAINAPEVSLRDDDPPLLQNLTNIYEDELLNGNLMMYNVVIDGLSNIEDAIDIVKDKLEIRMALNLKKLVIHGEFVLEKPTITEERGTFSVELLNVSVEGVASLLADPYGNLVITKVVPTVSSEESHVIVKSKMTPPSGPILESALMHLQNNIEKRYARVAYLEVYMHYPRKNGHTPLQQANWTIFEAQRFVSQRYDPYRVKMLYVDDPSRWHLGAFGLSGLSNFHLDEMDVVVNDPFDVHVIIRIFTDSLYGSFPFSQGQEYYIGEYTIEKIDFIGRIKLGNNSQKFPIMDAIGLEMTDCKCRFRNKATGMPSSEREFGFDVEDLFCLVIRNEFSSSDIIRTIQTKIFNKVELSDLRLQIAQVLYENRRYSEEY